EQARRSIGEFTDIFGRENFYLEMHDHGFDSQRLCNRQLVDFSKEYDLQLVAANDVHFLDRKDHEAHDVLICIGTNSMQFDENRLTYSPEVYFKTSAEMRQLFKEVPEAIKNTLAIADKCDLEIELDATSSAKYPQFDSPDGGSREDYFRQLCYEGLVERYGKERADTDEELKERLDYECGIMEKMGFLSYFLITWDFVKWAKDHDVPVGPGRGSAAGSLVAYVLGITDLCPIRFGLIFERFLNPERVSPPDIDMDFCQTRRPEVIQYVREKYGERAVSHIVTFGTLGAKSVVRDVARVLGLPYSEGNRIAKMIPNDLGTTLADAKKKNPELREELENNDGVRRVYDYSLFLEGLTRGTGIHAAGVVIGDSELTKYVPLIRGKEGEVVTQFAMSPLTDLGMLKMDFLGLKTLTVIHDAVVAVRERYGRLANPETGEEYDTIDDVPLDDPAVYKMMARGGTAGIFQFESNLANDKLRAMRCDRFMDLVATNALIRPGPLDSGMTDVYIERKLGRQEVTYPHPDLQKILEPTYGVIVYQEQVMRIASELAGFTLGEADVLRKAVGKKIAALIKQELGKFVERSVERGVDRSIAEDLADQIETFGRYGFNLSHSAAYSLISYHTAWLKAHYPAEYMAALLSSVLDSTDSVVKYIGACRDLPRYLPKLDDSLEVLPPDVNESGWKFTVTENGKIRFGLGAVKGVGHGAVQSVLAARKDGRFTTLFDFLERIDIRALNKRACEALIAAGALDAFGHRAQLLAGLDTAYGEVQARQAEIEAGQGSLFGDASALPRSAPSLPNLPEWDEHDRLAREKAALGFFISGHPLDRYREVVRAFEPVSSQTLGDRPGQSVDLPCVVTSVARQISRRDNSEWGKITVEDFHGTATVLAFRETWQTYKEILEQDAVVLVTGKVSGRERDEEDPPVFLDAARLLHDVTESGELAIQIELELESDVPVTAFEKAKQVLAEHPGASPIWFQLGQDNGEPAPRLRSRSLKATPDAETMDGLQKLFGRGNVRVVRAVIPEVDTSASDRRAFWRDKANRA
ncbi:MAG: DNA polymerase III subunit alpha, partial [Gemmatimonadetes bacterium]|nr:DNA polymerase III subunit alpha [Gemmatimonadota bacterium]